MLNASAELDALGQLIITGDALPDTVRLDVLNDGDLQIRDGSGDVIPIANHPGDPNDPLDPAAITSGQILVDLGGGNDSLHLDLPAELNVSVTDSGGIDDVNVVFSNDVRAAVTNLIEIDAETITVEPGRTNVSFTNDNVTFRGNVFLGVPGVTTNIDIGRGDFTVSGPLAGGAVPTSSVRLLGDVTFFAIGGAIDFSDATLTTPNVGVDVGFRLSDPATSDLSLGPINQLGGQAIENVTVITASSLTTSGIIEIDGAVTAQGIVDTADIDAALNADAIRIRASGQISATGPLTTSDGPILLNSSQTVIVSSDLNTTASATTGTIDLIAPSIQFVDADLRTSGGNITVIGTSQIGATVRIDSGNQQLADAAGRVDFLGGIESRDGSNDRLEILARGAITDGTVQIQGSVGNTPTSPAAMDLTELRIVAGVIDVRSIGVTDGPLELVAAQIDMSGPSWRTSGSGDVLIDGVLTLPTGNSEIRSAGSIGWTTELTGQTGTQNLNVVAQDDVVAQGPISNFVDLTVRASGLIQLDDDID
ncbi:MAG: hypothetical protein HKN47_13480 [Pirellulaceae bacterium]|nr:hypothetical protein [Pirellulaceae bacterium]